MDNLVVFSHNHDRGCHVDLITIFSQLSLRTTTGHVGDLTDQVDDGIICSEKLVSTVDLVEDELILTVPMVPTHQKGECPLDAEIRKHERKIETKGTIENKENGVEEPSTYRPFAGLGEQIAGSKAQHTKKRRAE